MADVSNTNPGTSSTSAQQDYQSRRPSYPVQGQKINKLIRELAPTGKPQEVLALFDYRVTEGAVRHWRAGRRGIPQWALDCLAQHVDARHAQQIATLNAVDPVEPIELQIRSRGAVRAMKARLWDIQKERASV